jgi:hypothetical protein
MRHRRCQLPLGTGPSLTRRDLVGQVGPEDLVVPDRVDPGLAVRDPVGQGLAVLDLAVLGLAGRAEAVDLVVLHQVDLAVPAHTRDPVAPDPVARVDLAPVDLAGQVGLVGLHPVDLAVPADIRGRVDPVGRVDPPGLVGRVDPVDQVMNRAGLVGLAVLHPVDLAVPADIRGRVDPAGLVDRADPVGRAGLVDRADLAIRADLRRRRTRPEVLSIAVAPRWVARGMCRTASAHPVMVRRLRPQIADGVGMAGPHPEGRRLGGMDRRPRVAGTAHRLQAVGTPHGMVRRAT